MSSLKYLTKYIECDSRKFFLGILLIGSYTLALSQTISGKIIDSDAKTPLEYVNIGVVGKNKGTVSDNQGWFSLELVPLYDKDTFRVSSIGYEPVSFVVEDIKRVFAQSRNELIIQMKRKIPVLTEVVFAPREVKRKVLGNKGKIMAVSFESNEDFSSGHEIGTLIKIKKYPGYINDINFVVTSSTYEDSVLFRVNIYKIAGAFPGENILKEPILAKMKFKKGVFTVDLAKYNIYVDTDFVASLEWISEMGTREVSFGMGLKSKSYMRVTSQANWDKFPLSMGIGIYTTIMYMK